METLNKQKTENSVVTRYAEAWRNAKQAEKDLEAVKAEMQETLAVEEVSYLYADGAEVTFKLVEGFRTNPVSYADAKTLTGFGEANMAKIAGNVDAKKVEAMIKIGGIPADLTEKLLPKAGYLQIRGTFAK